MDGRNDGVPFIDLAAQYGTIREEMDAAIREVLTTCQFVLGPVVETFEDNFGVYVGAAHAIGVGNGLDALRLTLAALDIGPPDEVILPANTFIATALAVSAVGARPVLVDCDPSTYNIDPGLLEDAVTERTKAVIVVHLYGQPADVDAVRRVTENRGLYLIEDAAQAHGASYKGIRCGALGNAGCFSFYPSKNLGAYGDGGMVTTNDTIMAERIRVLRNYGQRDKYEHVLPGVNSRLDALQAAMLGVKLRYLDRWNRMRSAHAARYREHLTGIGDLEMQRELPDCVHVYHLFSIATSARDHLQQHLTRRGIQTGIHYPKPIHLQPAYANLGYKRGDFPNAERLAERLLSLPMYPELTAEQVRYVAHQIGEFFESGIARSAVKR
jgi:dTDP-4-amino-4,6-dideoxygalactose transaminase